ncbi:MAG: malto-oligosyltrehalose trehalohydrolase [Actinomycetota bacterium]|nr:malto-oligosyltrehalose trehalohydrolase [Actinomycetota bacterium]
MAACSVSVWAPRPGRVDAVVAGQRRRLRRDERGWWTLEETVAAGTDYGFSLDGGPVLADPRSPWQPNGVEGPSRTVDHEAFAWTDRSWRGLHLPSAVLYELHVGTFSESGTFEGAIAHLDHLVELGVNAVELLPVAEASGRRGWGYDGVDLFASHHAYGGPDGLKALVDACHARGIGVVADVVYNHLGPAGNHLSRYGPYFTDRHVTNWGDAVNVDGPDSGEVRSFIVDNVVAWLRDYHIDGLRLDAVHAIADTSAVHIAETISVAVAALAAQVGRPLFVVAESDLNDPRFVRPRLAGGYGLDAAWADEFHHAIHAALTGETNGYYEDFGSLAHVATALRRAWVYAGEYSPHRRRVHGRAPVGLDASAFVVCIQNHDQVGNRALGERLCHLTTPGRARIAAALLLCSPFVPLLFQGEEWAASTPFQYFTDHADAELGRAVTEGRTHEFSSFGWSPDTVPDPQDPATFFRSKLDWSELGDGEHASMLEWYRTLIALRRRFADITNPDLAATEVTVSEAEGRLILRRGRITVVVNLGTSPVPLALPAGGIVVASHPEGAATRVAPDGVAIVDTGRPPAIGT